MARDIKPVVTVDHCNKSYAADLFVLVPVTLSDRKRRDERVYFFRRMSVSMGVPFDLERPNLAR